MLIEDCDLIAEYLWDIVQLNVYKQITNIKYLPRLFPETIADIKNRGGPGYKGNYLERIWMPSRNDVIDAVFELKQLHKDLSLDLENHLLQYTSGPYEIEGINFGEFKISLNILQICNDRSDSKTEVETTPISPVYECFEEYWHPHIDTDGLICLGDNGGDAIDRAMEELRLADVAEMVDCILNTYNCESPYKDIEYWKYSYFNCRDCDVETRTDDAIDCIDCGRSFCPECVCKNCAQLCYTCGEAVCDKCLGEYCKCSMENCDKGCCSVCPNCEINHEEENGEEE